ncbi:hypothetical protein R1flu_028812 [Riccia fluitans]|uniref:Uncharacterized protein n=1 Tax=Riccia fluitans TaxID=41844 RepID=A0ABD1XMR8_9MARC
MLLSSLTSAHEHEGQSEHVHWKRPKPKDPVVSNEKAIVNNLSDLQLKMSLCMAPGCPRKSAQVHFIIGPKAVSVLDLPDWKYLTIADAITGRQLTRTLWFGQFDGSNSANILSVLQKSPSVTQVWFSDKSGNDVLLGVLQ